MERVLIALQFIIKVCQMVDTQMWRRGSDTHVQNLMTHQTMLALGRWWSCYFVVLVHLYFMQSRPKQSASLFNDVDTRGQPWWSCKSEAARNGLNRFHIDEDNDYGDEDDEGDDNDVWIKRSDRKGGIPQLPILLLPSSSAQYRQPIICIDRIITVFAIINIVIILLINIEKSSPSSPPVWSLWSLLFLLSKYMQLSTSIIIHALDEQYSHLVLMVIVNGGCVLLPMTTVIRMICTSIIWYS